MKTILEEFSSLWPTQSLTSLQALIGNVKFLNYPDDIKNLKAIRGATSLIVIMHSGGVKEAVELLSTGFEHIIQRKRPDFAQELLTSALMIARPKSFLNNPIPFILSGGTYGAAEDPDSQLILKFHQSQDRLQLLNQLEAFLSKNPRASRILDLCIQAADELISNALFHAPVNSKGEHFHQQLDRASAVKIPINKSAKLFCRFTDYRVVIGCEDLYGSLYKRVMLEHLVSTLSPEQVKTRNSYSPGAGIGLRFMIGNAANFYMYCDKNKRSLIACGFLTAGQKANLTPEKHLHLSFT